MASSTFASAGTFTFTLPANIDKNTPMTVDLQGARGGGNGLTAGPGGLGGRVVGTLDISALTPGVSTITVVVGGVGGGGSSTSTGPGGAGGSNGGGAGGSASGGFGGSGGGGATDIRVGGTGLANRKAVAGGGGGSGAIGGGTTGLGGKGGAATGQTGGAGLGGSGGGTGGTAAAGGTGGVGSGTGSVAGSAGVSGVGGKGGNGGTNGNGAGGGGGGLFGGGGGGGATNAGTQDAGGGGGGSNSVTGLIASTTNSQGGSTTTADGKAVLTYNLVPNGPALNSPVGSTSVDLTLPIVASWAFSDPDVGDAQTKADLQWRIGTGAFNVISNASTSALASFTFTANFFAAFAGQTIEWQVRTYDSHNAQGPWSASAFFIPRAKPTAPTYVATPVISSNTPSVLVNTPDGALQFEFQITADVAGSPGAVLLDSGTVAVSGTPAQVNTTLTSFAYVNGTSYHVLFRYAKFAGVWSTFADSGPIVANINAPLQPTLTLTGLDDTGSVRVDVVNPGSDPHAPNHNDVFRTDVETNEEIRIATNVAINGTFTDWTPGFNREYRYRVVAVTATGAFTSSA